MITPLYAALLGFVLVALSVRTIRLRRRFQVAVGAGGEPSLERAIRVQANFVEYVPLALLLLFFLEARLGSGWWVHVPGVALLAGRVLHAVGVSNVKEDLRLRVTGMSLTFLVILGVAAALVFGYVI